MPFRDNPEVSARFRNVGLPTYVVLVLSPIAFGLVLGSMWECNWADVTINFNSFAGEERSLEADVGLDEIQILLRNSVRELVRDTMSYDVSKRQFGHLPVLRRSTQFGVAGLVAQIFLWISVGCFGGVVISVFTRILCKWPGVKTTMGLAIAQGFAGVVAVTAWSLQLPAVGVGRMHRFYYGMGFKSVLVASCAQTLVGLGGAAWALYLYRKEFKAKYTPVPGSAKYTLDDESDDDVEMEMTPWGLKKPAIEGTSCQEI